MSTKVEKIKQSDLEVYNTLPQSILIYDLNKIYFINTEAVKTFNLPSNHKAVLKKNNVLDFIKKPLHALVKECIESILKGKEVSNSEIESLDFEKKSVSILATSKLIYLDGQKVILSSINENTKQNIFSSNALNALNNLSNNSNKVFFEFEFYPKPHYKYISHSVISILGKTPQQVYEDADILTKLVHKDDLKEYISSSSEYKKTKSNTQVFKFYNNEKTIIYLEITKNTYCDENNKIIGLVGTLNDVTETKLAEIEIKTQNINYQNLIDGSPTSYVIHRDGKFLYVNNAFLNLLKVKSKDKLIGTPITSVINKKDEGRVKKRIKEIENNIKTNQFFNYKIIDSKKNIIDVEVKSLNIKFNNTDCILALINNLSEQKQIIKTESDNKLLQSEIKERKEIEKELVEKTNQLTSIFESSNHLIWTVNKKFELTSYNKNFASTVLKNHKVHLKEGDKIDTLDFKNKEENIKFWYSKYKEAFRGKKIEFEKEEFIVKKVVRQIFINPIFDEKNKISELSCIAHDITKTKLYEQKLLDQTAKLTAVIESGSHLVWTVNKNLELTSYNQNFFNFIQSPAKNLKEVVLRIENFVSDPELLKFWIKKYSLVLNGSSLTFTHKSRINSVDVYREIFLNPIYIGKEIVEVSAIAQDITERVLNEQRLVNQTAKLTAIFDSSHHYIWTIDTEQKLTSFNKNYFDLLNSLYTIQPYIGLAIKNRGILSNDKAYNETLEFHYHKAFNGTSTNFQIETLDKNYKKIYLEIFLNPIYHENAVIEVSGIAHNVTDSKYNQLRMEVSLKEKEVLLKEVHHRVKNNMQVVSSILNLQSSYVSDEYALSLLKESQNRIKTMAYIHESLYQNKSFTSVNFSDYLYTLLNNIVQSYSSKDKIKLNLHIEKITLSLDNSIPIGLIVNELVTNAIKHAFPNQKQGTITINLKSENNVVFLEVKDNGVGFLSSVSFENSNSLGLQLVNTLIEQIDGKLEFNTKENSGSKVLISFKI